MRRNKLWEFKGCVEVDGKIHSSRSLVMNTWAPTEKKALSNIRYRYRTENNLSYSQKIKIVGNLEAKDGE